MEVRVPSNALENTLRCTCVRLSTFAKWDNSVCGMGLKYRVLRVGESYGSESISFIMV